MSPAFGRAAAFCDAVSPEIMDVVRNRGFRLFGDSNAARGALVEDEAPAVSRAGRAFLDLSPGVRW